MQSLPLNSVPPPLTTRSKSAGAEITVLLLRGLKKPFIIFQIFCIPGVSPKCAEICVEPPCGLDLQI